MERVNVYVDGLNLFNRRLRGTPYKWLNLRLLIEAVHMRTSQFPDTLHDADGTITKPDTW